MRQPPICQPAKRCAEMCCQGRKEKRRVTRELTTGTEGKSRLWFNAMFKYMEQFRALTARPLIRS